MTSPATPKTTSRSVNGVTGSMRRTVSISTRIPATVRSNLKTTSRSPSLAKVTTTASVAATTTTSPMATTATTTIASLTTRSSTQTPEISDFQSNLPFDTNTSQLLFFSFVDSAIVASSMTIYRPCFSSLSFRNGWWSGWLVGC